MPANSTISVTPLDFDTIKEGIKQYVSSQELFKDYNFNGSTINMLLDILAYNSYQNAFYTSMVGNEMFLDSAQIRQNVISRAKMLDYVPTSAKSAYTELNVTVTPGTPGLNDVTIPKNEIFNAISESGERIQFITHQAYKVYQYLDYKDTIKVFEGYQLTERFTVSTVSPVRYIISNENVDVDSIIVDIRESIGSTNIERYTLANSIREVKNSSAVYFIQEIEDGLYEIYFGDGYIGKKPSNNNVVEITYRVCLGTESGNDIANTNSNWSSTDNNIAIDSVKYYTTGGSERENITAIKFNAPKNYELQNRSVLAEDYRRILLNEYGNIINSLRIWGGEENDPPVYGKVFISAAPKGVATILSNDQKDEIKKTLKNYNVMAIDVEFVDASYIYIIPTINVHYKSTKTSLSADDIALKVATTVQNYETIHLGNFENNVFKFSEFVSDIDKSDTSITYNSTTIELQKRLTPNLNSPTTYKINFGAALEENSLYTTVFGITGQQKAYLDDDGSGNVRLYYLNDNAEKIYENNTLGTINYSTGILILNSFNVTSVTDNLIKIYAKPKNSDLETTKYLLMLFTDTVITAIDDDESDQTKSVTVSTTGSVTQIDETFIGTIL